MASAQCVGDIPGAFTNLDLQKRYNCYSQTVHNRMKIRVKAGDCIAHPDIIVRRHITGPCLQTVYTIPGTTTLDWLLVDAMWNKQYSQLVPGLVLTKTLPIIKQAASIKAYAQFWNVTIGNAHDRLRKLTEEGLLFPWGLRHKRVYIPSTLKSQYKPLVGFDYELLPGRASFTQYCKFWNCTYSTAEGRLHRALHQKYVRKVSRGIYELISKRTTPR